jgi:predicted porin
MVNDGAFVLMLGDFMFAKKNVVAAAALTLVAAAAQAQVTLYGTLDASVGRKETVSIDGNGNFAKSGAGRVDSGDWTQSFLGFKGQEDLGGGLRAFFKLENGLNLDTGAQSGSTFWSRNAYIGLGGDFGALKLGRAENLFKLEGQAFNPFGESQTYATLFRPASVNALVSPLVLPSFGLDTSSWANSLTYSTPNLGGFTLSVQSSLAENQKATAANYAGGGTAVSARYEAGPLGLSAVIGEVRNPEAVGGVTGPAFKTRDWLLGASYDFGAVKLYGQYGQSKVDTKAASALAALDDAKIKRFQVGAGIPVTADGSVLVSYGQTKLDDVAGLDLKTRDLSLGYQHNLSKRTGVYAAVGSERLQADDDKITTTNFSVGVRHSF